MAESKTPSRDHLDPSHEPADEPVELGTASAASESRGRGGGHARGNRRRRRRRQFASWQDTLNGQPLATLVLGVLVIGAPQLLGGVLPVTVLIIAAASALCLAIVGLRAPAAQRRSPALGLMLLTLLVWTIIQCLPMACGAVRALAPGSAAASDAVAALLGDRASACTLTQDPGNTRQEVLKTFAVVASFLSAWIFAASGGRRRLLWLIAGSTLLMSLVAIAHGLFEIDRVFGIYTPTGVARAWLLAPLMNPNNLGAFAALGVPLWVGLAYRDPSFNVRLLGYVAIGLNTTAAILSLSRGAIAQLVAGITIMVFFVYRRSKQASLRPATSTGDRGLPLRELGLAVAGAAGVGVGAYLVGRDVLTDFSNSGFDKLELIAQAWRFAAHHWLTGVGRGAFASAFVSFHGELARFRYAENFVAQWAADWGMPLTAAALATIVVSLLASGKQQRPSLARQGAYVALFSWCAQNLVDFAFELTGAAVVAAALLAACVAPSSHGEAASRTEPRPVLRTLSLVGATLLIGVVSLLWIGPRVRAESLPAEQTALRRSLASRDRPLFREQLRAALRAHPSEPVLTLMAATESMAHKDRHTFAWLNRSMQLAPRWALPHQLAFRWLWQRGQGRQALLELKLAANIDIATVANDVCRLGRVDGTWALAAAPNSKQRRDYFLRTSACLSESESSRVFDEALLREYPDEPNALVHIAQRLLKDGEIEESLALLERVARKYPKLKLATILRVRTLWQLSRDTEVLDEVARELPFCSEDERLVLLNYKALALGRLGDDDGVSELLSEVRRQASANPQRLAASYDLEGQIHYNRHDLGKTLTAYREAYRISADTQYLWNIASLAESFGDRPQALWAYINLCQREPLGKGCERRNALLSARGGN